MMHKWPAKAPSEMLMSKIIKNRLLICSKEEEVLATQECAIMKIYSESSISNGEDRLRFILILYRMLK